MTYAPPAGMTAPPAGARPLDARTLRALVRHRHTPVAAGGRRLDSEMPGMLYTRGATLHSTMEYLSHAAGPTACVEVLDRLPAAERRVVETCATTDDVPYEVALSLWRSADISMRDLNAGWAEAAGAESIRVLGMKMYSGLLKKPSPVEFLSQHISLFQRYYRPGDMKVTEIGPRSATARLLGFEPADTLFCRRLSGGWRAVLEIAGGQDPIVEHARCSLEGDMFCEWVMRWR